MPNHLIDQTSPYLRQHANNPVNWYPWGEEALEKARTEDKPIFLSIGYAACHWCHVMERESFENLHTAEILNRAFVSIKVDREERPDLDMIYMQAVIGLAGNGGWPLSVFITPGGSPFYGGTYFPPAPRYGMPAFPDILEALARLWIEDRERLLSISSQVSEGIAGELNWQFAQPAEISPDISEQAVQQLIETYDWTHGGWGNAPRFPAPMSIDFLLTQAARRSKNALAPAVHALHAMRRGGMYDMAGGGFHRYSTDDEWLVPHFEKMLYDNAQLAQAYLHASLLTGDPALRQVCEETLQFIQKELTSPEGGFYSSLDADSEGVEGKYYVWTDAELEQILSPQEFEALSSQCEINPQGNFEGKIILRRSQISGKENSAGPAASLGPILLKLKDARSHRVRPATDDKILVAWNSLAIQAFAEAGRLLNRPDFLESARRNADFLLANLVQEGRLVRSWCRGVARQPAFLEDYASLIIALVSLYQADFDLKWYQAARRLANEMLAGFQDPAGGFFVTHQAASGLLIRPKDLQDNATPSGNALAAMALLLLNAYDENPAWLTHAEQMLSGVQSLMIRYPSSFACWLKALNYAPERISQAAITFPESGAGPEEILAKFNSAFRPFTVLACSPYPLPQNSPEILQSRPPLHQKPTLYLCKRFVCQQPVSEEADISRALLILV